MKSSWAVCSLAIALAACSPSVPDDVAADGETIAALPAAYAYNGADEAALAAYRRGWREILENGRWTVSEERFREAVRLDPDFVIGQALLARITQDVDEREALLATIEASLDTVDADGRLILDPFIMSIKAANARDRGVPLPDDFNEQRWEKALANFKTFADAYPAEDYILMEYMEIQSGEVNAAAALDALAKERQIGRANAPMFTFLEALALTKEERFDEALALADEFETRLDNPDYPQPHYLKARIQSSMGNLEAAKRLIDRAVELDPKHLIALDLQGRIDDALAQEQAGT